MFAQQHTHTHTQRTNPTETTEAEPILGTEAIIGKYIHILLIISTITIINYEVFGRGIFGRQQRVVHDPVL